MVTNESPLRTLFQPKEIELLICGSDVSTWVGVFRIIPELWILGLTCHCLGIKFEIQWTISPLS